jgi:PEP-CTERM motif
MIRTLHSILGLSSLLAVANIAAASTINVSTGQDGSGNIWGSGNQIDAHWTVTGANSETGTNPARTVFPDNVDYCNPAHGCAPAWVANDSLSDWIAFNPNATANGTGTYTTTFDLSGAVLSTVSLSGFWTIDDQGTLTLNGHQIASLPPPSQPWTVLNTFSVSTGSSDFVAGINTLTMQITATDDFEEGGRLNGTVFFSANTVPEPSSILLFASGVLALTGALLRRRQTAQSARH